MQPQAFEVYSLYTVTTSTTLGTQVWHEPCGTPVLQDRGVTVAAIMRACYAHTHACSVVNSVGAHSAVR